MAPPEAGPSPDAAATVLVAAGDVAACDGDGDERTAALLNRIPGTVAMLGNGAYPHGSAEDYARCYAPSWGRHLARTRPVPGERDYESVGAGYFGYFGAAAGAPERGYYSYELGAWHVVALNSNCDQVGGCQAGSAQERWLRADLSAHPADCTLAYWHSPRFSSDGGSGRTDALWRALYEAGAEVVLSGEMHVYERLAPLDANGNPDAQRGVRQFVVGTGGAPLDGFAARSPASEARASGVHGVLTVSLMPAGYRWEFVPVAEGAFTDVGTDRCHDRPASALGTPPASGAALAAAAPFAAAPLAAGMVALTFTRRRVGRGHRGREGEVPLESDTPAGAGGAVRRALAALHAAACVPSPRPRGRGEHMDPPRPGAPGPSAA